MHARTHTKEHGGVLGSEFAYLPYLSDDGGYLIYLIL